MAVETTSTGAPSERLPNSVGQRSRIHAIRQRGAVGRLGHCLTGGLQLDGSVDIDEIARSLSVVARRHPALTARFDGPDTHATGVAEIPLVVREVDGTGATDSWTRALEMAEAESEHPFSPDDPSRCRVTLLRVGADLHLMVLAVDPLVCDAWSVSILIGDLATSMAAGTVDDGYREVWSERQRWTTGAAGVAACRQRRAVVAGALDRWPVGATAAPAADPARGTERYLAIDDDVARAVQDRLRSERSTLLAVVAAAAVIGVVPGADPLALRSTFVGRETVADQLVVGAMATQVVLRTPPAVGTVAGLLRGLRAEVFACLSAQRVAYEQVADTLAPGPTDGASVAMVVLPKDLSGGTQRDLSVGGARASRTAVSVCPTGADIDLFVLEGAPPMQTVEHAELTIGACSWRGDSDGWVDRLLVRWRAALGALASIDWARDVAVARFRVEHEMSRFEGSV
jgi:hypothetical protein